MQRPETPKSRGFFLAPCVLLLRASTPQLGGGNRRQVVRDNHKPSKPESSGGRMLDKQEKLEAGLKEIRHLLSHLHGEVTALEESYSSVLSVLRKLEGKADLDDLTGLKRRGSFFENWQKLLDECQGLGESCGVLMI